MKHMRNSLLLTMVFVLFFTLSINAKGKKIKMDGSWVPTTRSVVPESPIDVEFDDETSLIYLQFVAYLGNVTVTVTNGNGNIVYNQICQGSYGMLLSIPMNSEPAGFYVISITDGTNYVSGQFQVE